MSGECMWPFKCRRCGGTDLHNIKITNGGEWVCGACWTDADWSKLTPTPQEAEISRLRTRLAESEARLDAAAKVSPMIRHNADLISKLAAAEAERDDLLGALRECVEALDDLTDVQNGPPLISYTKDWNEAMSRSLSAIQGARAAIAKVGGK